MIRRPERPTTPDPDQETPRWPLPPAPTATPRSTPTPMAPHSRSSIWIVRIWLSCSALGGLALVRAAHLTVSQAFLAFFGGSLLVVGVSGLLLLHDRHPLATPDPDDHDRGRP